MCRSSRSMTATARRLLSCLDSLGMPFLESGRPSEGLLQLFCRAEADGPGFAEPHQLIGYRIPNPARFARAKRPGSEARVAEASLAFDSSADVVKNDINNPGGRLFRQSRLTGNCFDQLRLRHSSLPAWGRDDNNRA